MIRDIGYETGDGRAKRGDELSLALSVNWAVLLLLSQANAGRQQLKNCQILNPINAQLR